MKDLFYQYCVYDSIYGDFIESFLTLKEAIDYVQQRNFTDVRIGKFLDEFTSEYEVIMYL